MKTRIITGAVLVVVLLLVLFVLPTWATAWLLAIMLAIAAYELLYCTGLVRHVRMVAYSAAAAFAVPLFCCYQPADGWAELAMLVYIALLVGEMMMDHARVKFEKVCICLVSGLLIPAALSSIVRILMGDNGVFLVATPFVLAFIPDTGAYFTGRFFGKHKLAPVISPKKTVEGAVGGLVTGVGCMLLYVLILQLAFDFKVNYIFAAIYGLVCSVSSIFGDLTFSVIKRQVGIKDYGHLFPGHGGILDRFDSMLVVGPLAEIMLLLIPFAS